LNPWTESVALARRHGVKIYACLPESRVKDASGAKERASLEALRGRALAAWAAGVDGIEMFNHFNPASPLWRELGDLARLRALPKMYFASVQGASSSRSYYPAQKFITLPMLTPDAPASIGAGDTRAFELQVGDDLRASPQLVARLELRVAGSNGNPPEVQWNDRPLTLTKRDAHTWSAPIESARVTSGPARVKITAGDAIQLADLILRIETR
jgi:hypothetical protein